MPVFVTGDCADGSPPQFPTLERCSFCRLLLSIAIVPLVYPNWWDRNSNKLLVSAARVTPRAGHPFAERDRTARTFLDRLLLLHCSARALLRHSRRIYIKGEFVREAAGEHGFPGLRDPRRLDWDDRRLDVVDSPVPAGQPAQDSERRIWPSFHLIVSNIGGLLTPWVTRLCSRFPPRCSLPVDAELVSEWIRGRMILIISISTTSTFSYVKMLRRRGLWRKEAAKRRLQFQRDT